MAGFGHLFEHSPWVVERAWERRPFAAVAGLHAAMMAVVVQARVDEQLALIRAHPELGARMALTADSEAEQQGAGLKTLDAAAFARFSALNAAYRDKFGFPFIICVRQHSKTAILDAFAQRLGNDADTERAQALREIGEIAGLRLQDLRVEQLA